MHVACAHSPTGTLYNPERGIAFKTDCGSRTRCPAARVRWRNELRERLELVEYLRAPDLWTFTTRTADKDAAYQTQQRKNHPRPKLTGADRTGETGALIPRHRRAGKLWIQKPPVPTDRGEPTRENITIMNKAITAVLRRVQRQFERQHRPGYAGTKHAAQLRATYGTAFPVRGQDGASLHIRIREAGELHGRLHIHVASDFAFLLHAWLDDTAIHCGLGHCQYERRASRDLARAARSSGPRTRNAAIGNYLAKYLSKSDDAWPWPPRTRLVSAGLGRKLPPRPAKPGWIYTRTTVAQVVTEKLGGLVIEVTATFYSHDQPDRQTQHHPHRDRGQEPPAISP